jgi:hypothetical protein
VSSPGTQPTPTFKTPTGSRITSKEISRGGKLGTPHTGGPCFGDNHDCAPFADTILRSAGVTAYRRLALIRQALPVEL